MHLNRKAKPSQLTVAGSGVDVVEVDRLRRSLERGGPAFDARVFTEAEQRRATASYSPLAHRAALFAAKEACFKAIGLPWDAGFDWLDLDVDPGSPRRPPSVRFSGAVARWMQDGRLLLAIGATRRHVTAVAIRLASHPPGTY